MFTQEARRTMTETLTFIKTLYGANEIKIIAIGGVVGGFISSALGGFDKQLIALCWLSLIDFITGLYAGLHNHNCGSAKMFRGFMKKLSIFGAVAVSVLVDDVLAVHMFRYAAIAGFGLMEAISIVENADRGGWGDFIPQWMRDRLEAVRSERLDKKQKAPVDNKDHKGKGGGGP